MKLTAPILTTTIALLTSAAFAADPVNKNASSSSATAITSGGTGKATVTIDVNGKKETREIDLGNGTEIKVTTKSDGNNSSTAVAVAGGSAKAGPMKTVTWLGVAAEEVSDELRAQLPLEPGTGLIVRSVLPDSPAEKAGVQKNDVLMKLDDQLLTNADQLRTLIGTKKDGDSVKLTYFRRGKEATLDVKLSTHVESGMGDWKNWMQKLPDLGPLFQMQSKAVIVGKDGKVIVGEKPDMELGVEKLEKAMRDSGMDEKSITDAKRALADTTKAILAAISGDGAAKEELQRSSGEVAKALEEAREMMEKLRQQAEQAAPTSPKKEPVEKPQ